MVGCGAEDRGAGANPIDPSGPGATGTSTASTGGGGGESGTGGAGGEEGIPPADTACLGEFAFRAVGMTFALPTPKDLGVAFGELAYDTGEHPIAVVLRSGDATQMTVAASATMENEDGTHSFVTDLAPTFIEAVVAQGSFDTAMAQPLGYLRLRHLDGFLDLELANIDVHAATAASCGHALVTLDASIPAAERDEPLTLESGETTVGELAGGDAQEDVPLRAVFAAESINFDFASL
jgi:hypothetical protein